MKNVIVICALSILTVACGGESKDVEKDQKVTSEKSNQKKTEPDDAGEHTSVDSEVEEIVESVTRIIGDKSVGEFKVGQPIAFPETSNNIVVKKEVQTRMTEEGPSEETVYVVSDNGENIMNLKPEFDMETGEYSQNIAEIIVISSSIRTADGIGVGSTIGDFARNYPDHKVWYTYVSGMYVIDSPSVNAQFLLDEEDFIGKLNIDGDMTPLELSDFKTGAKIIKVRMF